MNGNGTREGMVWASRLEVAVPGQEAEVLDYLERDPVRNLRMVYPLRRFGLFNLGLPEQGSFLVLRINDAVRGVLFRDNLGLVRWCPGGKEAEVLLEGSMELWGFPGALVGEEEETDSLLSRFPEVRRRVEHVEEEASMLLHPRAFRLPQERLERAALASDGDLEDWIELEKQLQSELLGCSVSTHLLRREARVLLEEGRAFVVREGGRAVSKAALEAVTPAADELGGVFTRMECRRKGHALSACAAACALSVGRGRWVRLETQRDNHAAISLYMRLGFTTLWHHLVVRLGDVDPGLRAGTGEACAGWLEG
jgi:GNAT superfamily N-acetyltransferase